MIPCADSAETARHTSCATKDVPIPTVETTSVLRKGAQKQLVADARLLCHQVEEALLVFPLQSQELSTPQRLTNESTPALLELFAGRAQLSMVIFA